MAKKILYIPKSYKTGFIADFEKNKYFQLQNNATSRADLFVFAIALALKEGKEPMASGEAGAKEDLVRAEYLPNYESVLSSVYFDKKLKDNTDQIDDICNRDEVYLMAEQYAAAGLGVLKTWCENVDEESLLYKLIGYMDGEYERIIQEVKTLV